MIQSDIEIKVDKRVIRGIVTRPPTEQKKYPMAIISHALMSDMSKDFYIDLEKSLNEMGFASIRFDFNGHGTSDGRLIDMTLYNEVEDLEAVFDYAIKLDFVDRLGLIGHSQGGVISSLLAAKRNKQVNFLVLLSPSGIMEESCRAGLFIKKMFDPANIPPVLGYGKKAVGGAYLKSSQDMDIYVKARGYKGPVCIIHSREDEMVPIYYSEKYLRLYENCMLKIIDAADHMFLNGGQEAIKRISGFLGEMDKKFVKVRNLLIGKGRPKVCIPILENTYSETLAEAGRILKRFKPDMIEWRVDYLEDLYNTDDMISTLKELRSIIGHMPLIFTLRTRHEGGMVDITYEKYSSINRMVAASGYVDLLDIEMLNDDQKPKSLAGDIHELGGLVVGSYHYIDGNDQMLKIDKFGDTKDGLSVDQIKRIMYRMKDLGADIGKLAIMPKSRKNVFDLLEANYQLDEEDIGMPIITMSMGKEGIVSRIAGQVYGSSVTFATAGKNSAPGQLDANDTLKILDYIDRNL